MHATMRRVQIATATEVNTLADLIPPTLKPNTNSRPNCRLNDDNGRMCKSRHKINPAAAPHHVTQLAISGSVNIRLIATVLYRRSCVKPPEPFSAKYLIPPAGAEPKDPST